MWNFIPKISKIIHHDEIVRYCVKVSYLKRLSAFYAAALHYLRSNGANIPLVEFVHHPDDFQTGYWPPTIWRKFIKYIKEDLSSYDVDVKISGPGCRTLNMTAPYIASENLVDSWTSEVWDDLLVDEEWDHVKRFGYFSNITENSYITENRYITDEFDSKSCSNIFWTNKDDTQCNNVRLIKFGGLLIEDLLTNLSHHVHRYQKESQKTIFGGVPFIITDIGVHSANETIGDLSTQNSTVTDKRSVLLSYIANAFNHGVSTVLVGTLLDSSTDSNMCNGSSDMCNGSSDMCNGSSDMCNGLFKKDVTEESTTHSALSFLLLNSTMESVIKTDVGPHRAAGFFYLSTAKLCETMEDTCRPNYVRILFANLEMEKISRNFVVDGINPNALPLIQMEEMKTDSCELSSITRAWGGAEISIKMRPKSTCLVTVSNMNNKK
eukprot:GHVL01036635.1.p1 GENE.GHVL01036635.1~~GHVL01036635.1.p1  ORF type:complete len:436 (+),score=68.64 GHVL01036635.1:1061-2368(+)